MRVRFERFDGVHRGGTYVVPEEFHHLSGIGSEVRLDETGLPHEVKHVRIAQGEVAIDILPGIFLVKDLGFNFFESGHDYLVAVITVCRPVLSLVHSTVVNPAPRASATSSSLLR